MDILVYADWFELKGATLLGRLCMSRQDGRDVCSFSFEKKWLESGFAQQLDPDLLLISGPQYPSGGKKIFGLFQDASPESWGSMIMKKRESLLAGLENRKEKMLFPEDYLLAVDDQQRRGALRFKLTADGPFLTDNTDDAPPWTSLQELEYASLQLEDKTQSDAESLRWLNILRAPGASLGGARPKAGVADEKGSLWIAKFPAAKDIIDVGAWEMVVNTLAIDAGLDVAPGLSKKFSEKHHTYLSKRFDRIGTKRRMHFASARALLGKSEDTQRRSYLELAGFIIKKGADVAHDLEELWRRMVFNIAVKNTGDHFGNHGFLLTNRGWLLSPAYDMNPNSKGLSLSLNISDTDNSLDFSLALSVAKYFRVEKNAESILKRIRRCVGKWKGPAEKLAIPAGEIAFMATAFEE